jgi:alpha-beta hydrolase superfamily lysophospholipase
LPRVDGLVLLAPAIGVSPAASLAVWQAGMAHVPGLGKAAWESMAPEFDPYKYQSFAINAAVQIHALTVAIADRVSRLASPEGVRGLPRIIAFQSAADATVSAEALVRVLFEHLAPEGHRLVVFDINRRKEAQFILVPDAAAGVDRLLARPSMPFALTVLRNAETDQDVTALDRAQNASEVTRTPVGLEWPQGIFSLSHVGLPFPLDDPHYGATPPAVAEGIYLGRPRLLGELGFLALPERNLMRLRFNPFYPYMEKEILEFMSAPPGAAAQRP